MHYSDLMFGWVPILAAAAAAFLLGAQRHRRLRRIMCPVLALWPLILFVGGSLANGCLFAPTEACSLGLGLMVTGIYWLVWLCVVGAGLCLGRAASP